MILDIIDNLHGEEIYESTKDRRYKLLALRAGSA